MRFNNLDLNLLVVLDAILTEASVTRASQKLHLSQSATSSALARLRDYFGDPLFVSIGRELRPTPLAEDLAEPTRQLLADVQSNIIGRQGFDPQQARIRFSIAASDYIVRVFLAEMAKGLSRDAPGVQLDIIQLSGESVRTLITKGSVDFLICPADVGFPELPQLTLFSESFVVMGCAGNEMLGDAVSMQTLEEMGHVTCRLGHARIPSLDDKVCEAAGLNRRIEIVCGAFDHIASFITGTNRIAIVQEGLAQYYANLYPLKLLPLPFEARDVREVLQWQSYMQDSPAHRWFRDYVSQFF